MNQIYYIDRKTKKIKEEKVYFGKALLFLYGSFLGRWLAFFITRFIVFSIIFGWLQRRPFSRRKILPFIEKYEVDASEFSQLPESYRSFDDFFTRKLKPEARPLTKNTLHAVIPADGRYLAYQHVGECDGFVVKGKKFSLETLLQNPELASRYGEGALVMARLCPSDYHRFHFPWRGVPGVARLINGPLHSVNPIAIRRNLAYLVENKRMITEFKTAEGQTILVIEVGALNVGSIHQTYVPGQSYGRGDEKGYFSFGGSSMLLLFEPGHIVLDEDLLLHSKNHQETLCLFGQSLGKINGLEGA